MNVAKSNVLLTFVLTDLFISDVRGRRRFSVQLLPASTSEHSGELPCLLDITCHLRTCLPNYRFCVSYTPPYSVKLQPSNTFARATPLVFEPMRLLKICTVQIWHALGGRTRGLLPRVIFATHDFWDTFFLTGFEDASCAAWIELEHGSLILCGCWQVLHWRPFQEIQGRLP